MKNKDIVSWWERKRKLYNVLLILLCVYIVYDDYYTNYRPEEYYDVSGEVFIILFWLFGANIFYTAGAGLELAFKHYGIQTSIGLRWVLFGMGLLFSLVWTAYGFS